MTERSLGVLQLSLDPRALRRAGEAFDASWAALSHIFREMEKEDARSSGWL